jgi:hypothetical protein
MNANLTWAISITRPNTGSKIQGIILPENLQDEINRVSGHGVWETQAVFDAITLWVSEEFPGWDGKRELAFMQNY